MGLWWEDDVVPRSRTEEPETPEMQLPRNPSYWDELEDPDVELPPPGDAWDALTILGLMAAFGLLAWFAIWLACR